MTINWNTAKQMICDYQESSNTNNLQATPATLGLLKGLRTDIASIEAILNSVDDQGRPPKDFGIFFGLKQTSGGPAVTTILVGISEDNAIMEDTAHDFCEPCPTDCPTNYPNN